MSFKENIDASRGRSIASRSGPEGDVLCPKGAECRHGIECTIDGHSHRVGPLSGPKRRLREASGKKAPDKPTRYKLCKHLRVGDCGNPDHFHCHSSNCSCTHHIVQKMIEATEVPETDLYDEYESLRVGDPDIPSDILYARTNLSKEDLRELTKTWTRLDGPNTHRSIEEQGQINATVGKEPEGVKVQPENVSTPAPTKSHEQESPNSNDHLNVQNPTNDVPSNEENEVSSMTIAEFLGELYPTREVTLFFTGNVPGEKSPSMLSRMRDWCLRRCPLTRIDKSIDVNECRETMISEYLDLQASNREEVKWIWKSEWDEGDALRQDKGQLLFFLNLYPAMCRGRVYWDVVEAAMESPDLLRARGLTKENSIPEYLLPKICDWVSRFVKDQKGRCVTTLSDTIICIVNQIVARSIKFMLATTPDKEVDFRKWGGARRRRVL